MSNLGAWLNFITLIVGASVAYFVGRRVVGDLHRQAAEGWRTLYEAEVKRGQQHDEACREQIAANKALSDQQIAVLTERQLHTEKELAAHKVEGHQLREFNLALQGQLSKHRDVVVVAPAAMEPPNPPKVQT